MRRPPSPIARPAERGLALIAVLWGLVLLAVIATSFAATTRTEARLARNFVENAKARALAEAGVLRAVLGLLEQDPARRLAVDGTAYRFVFAEGEARLAIQDEGGKIDLNRARSHLLKGLFTAVGVETGEGDALVDAILDYRDANDAKRLNGAEDDDYRAAGRAYGAKDRPFEAVEELQQVLGMTPALYRSVAPALTVYSRKRNVNKVTATPLARLALGGIPGAEGDGGELPDEADEEADEGGEEIEPVEPGVGLREIGEEGGDGATVSPRSRARVVTIRAEARTSGGTVYVREVVVRLGRTARVPFRIVAWRQG